MNHQIMQSELYLLLSNTNQDATTKQELEAAQSAFFSFLCEQVESSDFTYAHRLLTTVEGKFRTLKEELSLTTFESEKKYSNPYLHH